MRISSIRLDKIGFAGRMAAELWRPFFLVVGDEFGSVPGLTGLRISGV